MLPGGGAARHHQKSLNASGALLGLAWNLKKLLCLLGSIGHTTGPGLTRQGGGKAGIGPCISDGKRVKIENLRIEQHSGRTQATARVVWEDSDRPTKDYFFAVDEAVSDDLIANPDAFLVACIVPGMRHGDRRIAIEGEICPYLKSGLETAMSLLQYWYRNGSARQPLAIEGKTRTTVLVSKRGRAAFFLTGGVDSLATLRRNRLAFPADHPAALRDGVIIFGLEVADPMAFQYVVDLLSELAREEDFTILPVYTNVRYLDDDWVFWIDEFEAAVLSSVVHALIPRLSNAFIASSFDYPALHAHGSHPLLDPNYSSYGLRIHHDAVAISRFEKTRLLSEWDLGIRYLRVCNRSDHYRPGILNCGRCEKCLRTLTALLILGKIDEAHAFAQRTVTADLIREHAFLSKTDFPFWAEMVEPLKRQRRQDLVDAVQFVINRYRGEVGWKGSLKAWDRLHLGGALLRLKHTLRGRGNGALATAQHGLLLSFLQMTSEGAAAFL